MGRIPWGQKRYSAGEVEKKMFNRSLMNKLMKIE